MYQRDRVASETADERETRLQNVRATGHAESVDATAARLHADRERHKEHCMALPQARLAMLCSH